MYTHISFYVYTCCIRCQCKFGTVLQDALYLAIVPSSCLVWLSKMDMIGSPSIKQLYNFIYKF